MATCSGEVYNTQAVEGAASQRPFTMASNELGEGYQLVGEISTTITSVQVVESQLGTLSTSMFSQGTWAFQFTSTQKQRLAHLISGKSISDAQKLLLQQRHIEHAMISIMYGFWFWNTLPTDEGKITII
jgi:VCBS repeat-containing protein